MENPLQRMLDMAAVHSFYTALLKEKLGFEVPVPHDIQVAVGGKEKVAKSADQLRRWLALLDLAITPLMIRDALQREFTRKESAEALLRYFYEKRSPLEIDRDKSDFTITYLFRRTNAPLRSADEWSVDLPSPFEEEIYGMLGRDEVLPLPEEHRQLLREFPFIRQEVDDFQHFDKLMDSGIMQRVRDIKMRFGSSFYHPRVLSNIAEYNVFIGDRFDELFREATRSIKQFAMSVQQAGGSIMSRVEDDVTVKQLTEVQEDVILQKEYSRAQEQLRKVSSFKKAVDRRRKAVSGTTPPRPQSPLFPPEPMVTPGGSASDIPKGLDPVVEEGKLRSLAESIRSFILAADTRSANVYPMRHGNLPLTPAEIDAFRAEFHGEKSFRGDYAHAMAYSVALIARMLTELEDFKQRQQSAYLWKPHAESLAYLLQSADRTLEQCASILQIAESRGLVDKAAALNATLQKVRSHCATVVKAMESVIPQK